MTAKMQTKITRKYNESRSAERLALNNINHGSMVAMQCYRQLKIPMGILACFFSWHRISQYVIYICIQTASLTVRDSLMKSNM